MKNYVSGWCIERTGLVMSPDPGLVVSPNLSTLPQLRDITSYYSDQDTVFIFIYYLFIFIS